MAKLTTGMASFVIDKSLCVATLPNDVELKQWLKSAEGGRTDRLRLIGLDGVGGLAKAGRVTPYGI